MENLKAGDRILNQKGVPRKQSNHQQHLTIIIIIIIVIISITAAAIHVLISNSIADLILNSTFLIFSVEWPQPRKELSASYSSGPSYPFVCLMAMLD